MPVEIVICWVCVNCVACEEDGSGGMAPPVVLGLVELSTGGKCSGHCS